MYEYEPPPLLNYGVNSTPVSYARMNAKKASSAALAKNAIDLAESA